MRITNQKPYSGTLLTNNSYRSRSQGSRASSTPRNTPPARLTIISIAMGRIWSPSSRRSSANLSAISCQGEAEGMRMLGASSTAQIGREVEQQGGY